MFLLLVLIGWLPCGPSHLSSPLRQQSPTFWALQIGSGGVGVGGEGIIPRMQQ